MSNEQPPERKRRPFMLSAEQSEEMKRWAEQSPVLIEMPRMDLLVLIGNLQLALRHPGNIDTGAKVARAWIAAVRAQIAEPGSLVDSIIEKGFDPSYDL